MSVPDDLSHECFDELDRLAALIDDWAGAAVAVERTPTSEAFDRLRASTALLRAEATKET